MLSRFPALVDCSRRSIDDVSTGILVIGGGVAGFSAAIAAAPRAEVLCVTKDTALTSNTHRAQGGVAAVLADEDSIEAHRDDTLAVGCGLGEAAAVEVVVREGPDRVQDLIRWGGRFDESDGRLSLGLEGGHSHNRIVHAQGDRTGVEVQATLLRRLQGFAGVELWEHGFAVDLLVDEGVCRGALIHRDGRLIRVRADAVILATGGAGQVYRETTNPPIATGDGLAMALRAGVSLRDMEFVQFHPTTLYVAGSARHLVTEAVRGEGALLRDQSGHRFMPDYHPDAELAPRDVVSRSIMKHLAATGDAYVLLDLTHLGSAFVRSRFPRLWETCAMFRIDVGRDLVPIHPSAHYLMGGVIADLRARSSLPGLWACGEVASSGLHGANRLASNSLLEGLVFGERAGRDAADCGSSRRRQEPLPTPTVEFQLDGGVINAPDMANSIKSLMWKDVGVIRRGETLRRASARLETWSAYLGQCAFLEPAGWELVNALTVGQAITASALARDESRGAHLREDHPETNEERTGMHTIYEASGKVRFERAGT